MGKLYPLSFIPNALSVSYWFINYLNKVLYILSYEFLSNVGMTSEGGTGDGLKKKILIKISQYSQENTCT